MNTVITAAILILITITVLIATVRMVFGLVRKLRRNLRCVLLGVVLIGVLALYNEVTDVSQLANGE